MGIETTYHIFRGDAINMIKNKNIAVFENDCNARLEHIIYKYRHTIFENYIVVDWTMDDEPSGQEWPYWKNDWQ